MCSCRLRPIAPLPYEHMFCSTDTPPFAQRLFGALHLIRSFLLLEDDYVRDWEVDQDEPAECLRSGWEEPDRGVHPHRVALRSGLGARRPGVLAPREQVCLCPVSGRARAGVTRGSSPLDRSCAEK